MRRTRPVPTRAGLPALWGGERPSSPLERGPEVLGALDFRTDRSVHYLSGQGWSIFAPGREVMGEDQDWEEPLPSGSQVQSVEPLWLIELVRGATQVLAEPRRTRRGGEHWRHRVIAASRPEASRLGPRMLQPTYDELAATQDQAHADDHLRVEVWIDDAGRLRRVEQVTRTSAWVVELGDFGAPIRIEFPPRDVIWRAIDHLPR